jgi:hypothetical protein
MGVSNKYRTFNQLLEDVSVDLSSFALEGMIEPQQLIKVALRVNYDLGLRIQRTKEAVLDVEHSKTKLPWDFAFMNYAFLCGDYEIHHEVPSGTYIDTTNPVPYVPDPGYTGPCSDPTCKDVCVIKPCGEDSGYQLVQRVNPGTYRRYTAFAQITFANTHKSLCDCPNINIQAPNIAEIRDGFVLTNFETGKLYINYQSSMEDPDGNLLVIDHPYCNEYYEYALKQRILENLVFAGENVVNQLNLVEARLRAARNNALSFVNTPDFQEMKKMWWTNRRAQYHNYYNMFKSYPVIENRYYGR